MTGGGRNCRARHRAAGGQQALLLLLAVAATLVTACKRVEQSQARLDPGERLLPELAKEAGVPVRPGNALELLENSAVFPALERDIRAARSSIHVLMYIWRGEGDPSRRIGRAVLERRPGVACRIVIDPFGSLKFDERLERALTASGCHVRRYDRGPLPDPLARNHRKILVVDGRVAITGGFGIWESWLGQGRKPHEWRDTAVRVRGPVVEQLQRAFEQNWRETGGPALGPDAYPALAEVGTSPALFVATSPRANQPSVAEAMYRLLVDSARRRLWIANSYFVPDRELQRLIVERRKAGVDVRVLAPGPVHDVPPVRAAQRATYETLIENGVRIYEYTASMMHSKTMVVDDRYLMIGSTNMDALSFEHLEEGSLVARDPHLVRQMAANFLEDLRYTKEITKEIWRNRDFAPEVGRRGADLFRDWM